MSIRELFENYAGSALSAKTLESASIDVESAEYIEEYLQKSNRFLPTVDYSNPRNFVKYGSAAEYYAESFDRITETYPFDGSKKEKIQWENSSSQFDLYVFENLYPRTNGHIILGYNWAESSTATFNGKGYSLATSPEYISVKGVMNTGSYKGNQMSDLSDGFENSNYYDVEKNRTANLKYDITGSGVTVEFWAKHGENVGSETETFFDLWNGVISGTTSQAYDSYGRFTIEVSGSISGSSSLYITAQSGTNGIFQQSLGSFTGSTDWNHYAVRAYADSGSHLVTDFYLNGELNDSQLFTSASFNEVTGSLIAYVGALQTAPSGSLTLAAGWGSYSGSMDELRFWKVKRTHQQIGRNWFTQVGAGTNTDDANTDLGIYYKFNEGVVQNSANDAIVIDYSGRTSHGIWTNYISGSRQTSSAMVEANAADFEFLDPIIYSFHPTVLTERTNWVLSGTNYDYTNNSSLINSIPSWITEEDVELVKLTQIMASYFDSIHLLVEELPKIKSIQYLSGSGNKPYPFADRLLMDVGFDDGRVFAAIENLEKLSDRDEEREFTEKLYNIKNIIYQNLHNNAVDIFKKKGTEDAFRNVLRCFGVDDELIKINYYSNNEEYQIEDNFKTISVAKKFIDFNRNTRFNGIVYQQTSSGVPESVSYIYGSGLAKTEQYIPFTVEAEVIFPLKPDQSSKLYPSSSFPDLTSSIFGFYGPITGALTNTTFETGTFGVDMQVYAVRDLVDSKNIKFVLTGSTFNEITSSFIEDVYDNSRWTVAVRVSPEKLENAGISTGSDNGNYILELIGYNSVLDQENNFVHLTGTVSYAVGSTLASAPKRFYIGANKTNFTGATVYKSDVKVGQFRYWSMYLDNDTIKKHSFDVQNYGLQSPIVENYKTIPGLNFKTISDIDTLALNWDFEKVTGSNANGEFLVDDYTSGSADLTSRYNIIGSIVKNQHTGIGYGFNGNDTKVVDKEYIASAKLQRPDSLNSENMVKILQRDDEIYTLGTRPIKYFIAFEKSMYQNISEKMIEWFAGARDFNNLIGQGANRYSNQYSGLRVLKKLFFEKVDNIPSAEKYTEYYKWFDNSIFVFLRDLIPASANTSKRIRNVIESHLFERNKYWTKYPTMEFYDSIPTVATRGVNELKYPWKIGHHPVSFSENENCFYWNQRAERSGSVITSGDSLVDDNRAAYLSASIERLERDYGSPIDLVADFTVTDKGMNHKRNYAFHRSLTSVSSQKRIYTSQTQIKGLSPCFDGTPIDKRYHAFGAIVAENTIELFEGNQIFPFSILSSSISGGIHNKLASNIGLSIDIADYHNEYYNHLSYNPMQGPFTNKHVGGFKTLHQNINYDLSNATKRIENKYTILEPDNKRIIVYDPDTNQIESDVASAGNISTNPWPKERFWREEYAKRPINIKNIAHMTGSPTHIGNYSKEYEYMMTQENDYWHRDFTGSLSETTLNTPVTTIAIYDSELPRRTEVHYKTNIEERFSSPGEVKTMTRGWLDFKTETRSAYNVNTYRLLDYKKFINKVIDGERAGNILSSSIRELI